MTMQAEDETQPTTSLAPSWLSREQRWNLDQIINKLVARGACTICGSAWPHNSRTAYGFDHDDRVVIVGECCLDLIAIPIGSGFFSRRKYGGGGGFLSQKPLNNQEPLNRLPNLRRGPVPPEIWERFDQAVAQQHRDITAANKQFESGSDDQVWFEKNPTRSHRARMPFPGEELLLSGPKIPAECTSFILVRQIKPGTRIRLGFYLNTALLPVPDDEAQIHAMFEIASGREPAPTTMQALCGLREKYMAHGGSC
jgi:hypothetical protein